VPRAGLMFGIENKSIVSKKKKPIMSSLKTLTILIEMPLKVIFHTVEVITIPFADVLGLYMVQYKTVLSYIHRLQSQVPSVDVLGICKLPGINLCYIHTLQSQSPFTYVLGLGNVQYQILLCCTHYVTQSFSPLQYLSQYLQTLQSMSVRCYWSFTMIMQNRQFIEMLMNIIWRNMIIN